MTSSTNERQIKARDNQAARDRITDELVTQRLMMDRDGRRWVWQRLSEGKLYIEEEHYDTARLLYEKGKRAAALRLLADVQRWCPNEYILMANEAQDVLSNITKKDPNYVGSSDDL